MGELFCLKKRKDAKNTKKERKKERKKEKRNNSRLIENC